MSPLETILGYPVQDSEVTVPGGVPESWRCGTRGHGQRAHWDQLGLDVGTLEDFPNLSNSVTLG